MRSRSANPAPVAAGARDDQAAGLRSLLGHRNLRVLPVLGTGALAQGAVAAHLARALAASGMAVMLLDGIGSAVASVGLKPPHDLLALIEGERAFGAVAQAAAPGLRAVLARAGLAALVAADAAGDDFFRGFLRVADPVQFMVLNLPALPAGHGGLWLPLPAATGDVLLVMEADEAAMTAAYSIIKRACAGELRCGFQVLVNGASGERGARAACRQVADTARRFLGVTVNYAGHLPRNSGGAAYPARGHAESARILGRIAAGIPGWRLADCAIDATDSQDSQDSQDSLDSPAASIAAH